MVTLLKLLGNRKFRLDNLYTILDKEDNKGILKLNLAQKTLYKIKHPKTITLKSRQQGISTYKVAENLDKCIFQANTQAGIQSYGQSEARKLSRKALLMWEEFDPDIKKILNIKLVSANQEGFTFSNGSVLKIGNFRGDTLSSLHVSELAKIASKFPEKAEELNTGAFEAVSTNSAISIESTAEGATGLFYKMWKQAKLREKLVGLDNLTPLDFYPVFLSWLEDPDCSMEHYYAPASEDEEYFRDVEEYAREEYAREDFTLTQAQKNWCSAKRSRLGENFDREYPYSPDVAFSQSVEGTYYAQEYKNLTLVEDSYDLNLLVHSAMDLGMNDTFSIGFFQKYPDGHIVIIGEYHNNGCGLEHYADMYIALTKRYGWKYGKTYVPHDIKVKELIAGKTRWQALLELGFSPVLVKKHSLIEGIEATRQFLKTLTVDKSCEVTIAAIQNYRKKFDKKYSVYLDSPVHDEHSHAADMVRYLAMGDRYATITDIMVKQVHNRSIKSSGSMDI